MFVLFCGYIDVYPSEYSQLRCTVPNLPQRVMCLWYLVWLSQLHGEDNTENTIKNYSLKVLKRKNIKVHATHLVTAVYYAPSGT